LQDLKRLLGQFYSHPLIAYFLGAEVSVKAVEARNVTGLLHHIYIPSRFEPGVYHAALEAAVALYSITCPV
jgi:hypothetical protein